MIRQPSGKYTLQDSLVRFLTKIFGYSFISKSIRMAHSGLKLSIQPSCVLQTSDICRKPVQSAWNQLPCVKYQNLIIVFSLKVMETGKILVSYCTINSPKSKVSWVFWDNFSLICGLGWLSIIYWWDITYHGHCCNSLKYYLKFANFTVEDYHKK